MIDFDPAPQSMLEFTPNFASVPLAVGRNAVNEAGIYVYKPGESIADHFTPTDEEDFDRPDVVRAAE